eukprot:5891268-Prymnesium_polylepis.1
MDGRKWFQGHVSFAQHLVAHTATNLRHRLGPWSPMVRDVAWGFGARGKCCKAGRRRWVGWTDTSGCLCMCAWKSTFWHTPQQISVTDCVHGVP